MEPKTYEAQIDDHQRLPFTISELEAMDLRLVEGNRYHFIHNGRSFHVEVELEDYDKKYFELRIDGFRHRVQLSDPYDVLVQRLGLTRKAVHIANQIKAPMPGLIREIMATPGAELKAGDPVLILEAMKMENIIKSPGDGRIASIEVVAGSAVEKGQVLVTFAD